LKKAEKRGIIVKKADLNNALPLEAKSFDVVVSNQVIEHLFYPVKFMREVYRILKPNEYAVISTENLSSWDNIVALLFVYTPFSMEFDGGLRKIGNPFSPHEKELKDEYLNSHVRIFTWNGLVELARFLRFKPEEVLGNGHFLGKFGEIIDKKHSRFITLKLRKFEDEGLMDKPLVSAVVPTFNSEKFFEECLKSVRGQTYPNIEIIVVDNYSRDKTREIAENYGARIFLSDAKRSEARNIGVERAKGKLVLFVDSDMELDFSVVDECVEKIGEGNDGVIIPEISVGSSFWAKCKALEKTCYIGDDSIEASRFFRRTVFETVGGYDSELEAGEDWDLNQRTRKAGYSVGRIDAFIKHHEGRLSLQETMLKKRHYGKTLQRYRMKHPGEARQQLKLIRPAMMRNWRKLAKDPIHALGMFFMKACEFLAAGFGLVVSKL